MQSSRRRCYTNCIIYYSGGVTPLIANIKFFIIYTNHFAIKFCHRIKMLQISNLYAATKIENSERGRGRFAVSSRYTYGHLILDTGDVEEGLDLLPQLPPWPGTQLHVLAQIALDNLQSQTLFLDFLVFLAGQVTSDPGLHPGHDLAQTFITELFHLTQDTSAEEYL